MPHLDHTCTPLNRMRPLPRDAFLLQDPPSGIAFDLGVCFTDFIVECEVDKVLWATRQRSISSQRLSHETALDSILVIRLWSFCSFLGSLRGFGFSFRRGTHRQRLLVAIIFYPGTAMTRFQ